MIHLKIHIINLMIMYTTKNLSYNEFSMSIFEGSNNSINFIPTLSNSKTNNHLIKISITTNVINTTTVNNYIRTQQYENNVIKLSKGAIIYIYIYI